MSQKPHTENLPAKTGERGLVISSNKDLQSMVHQAFPKDKFNVLVPNTLNFQPGIAVAITRLDLDPDKDFYSIGGSDPILRANAVRKIAGTANVQWDEDKCGFELEEYDKNGQPIRLRYKAVCRVLTSMGTIRKGIGTYEWNYHNDLKDYRFQKKEWKTVNGKKKKVPTGELDMNQINQRRSFAVQQAETGAKSRAIYDALEVLERSLKQDDVKKPFIIPCAVFNVDYSDPNVRMMIAHKAIGAERDSYGPGKPIKAEYSVEEERNADGKSEEASQAESEETTATPEEPPEEPPEPEEKRPSPEQIRDAFHDEWLHTSVEERANKIRALGEKADHDIGVSAKGKKLAPPEKWEAGLQMQWIMYLAEKAGEIPPKPKKGGE